MFYILFLLFFCAHAHAENPIMVQESVINTPQVVPLEEIVQPTTETTSNNDIDFDDLTNQMEESGIDFTVEQPSTLQLLLRKIGMHLVPLLPYYLTVRKWTNQKIAWINAKQNEYSMNLHTLLALIHE